LTLGRIAVSGNLYCFRRETCIANLIGGFVGQTERPRYGNIYHTIRHWWSVVYLGFGKGGHGERAEREPITGVQGQSPWSESQGGKAPLKLKHFLLLNVQWKPQIRSFFWNLETQKITDICKNTV